MKRTEKTVNGRPYIIEEFANFHELIKTNDSRTQNFGGSSGGRDGTDNEWCGASYEDAVQMLCYGWEDKEKVQQIYETIKKIERTMDVPKMGFKNDIVGYAPIVPLALQGVPQSMINCTRKPKKAKVVNLIVEISVNAGYSPEQKLEWGAKLIAKISNLEKNGYRVRIDCVKVHTEDYSRSKVHAMKILLKHENQPFDIKRMMFPLAHSAMQRRIVFDWYERLPDAYEISGYGRPLYHHSSRDREEIFKQIAGDTKNAYCICCMDDIDQALKGVA